MLECELFGTGDLKRAKNSSRMDMRMGSRLHIARDGRELRHKFFKVLLILLNVYSTTIISYFSIDSGLLPLVRQRGNECGHYRVVVLTFVGGRET